MTAIVERPHPGQGDPEPRLCTKGKFLFLGGESCS